MRVRARTLDILSQTLMIWLARSRSRIMTFSLQAALLTWLQVQLLTLMLNEFWALYEQIIQGWGNSRNCHVPTAKLLQLTAIA
jgi:hypothetical protein